MVSERKFWLYDASFMISASIAGPKSAAARDEIDWETYNRARNELADRGFVWTSDPDIDLNYPVLSKWHHMGRRETPAGTLFVRSEAYPTGCKFEFYQEEVTVHRRSGRFDFDRREKMPYLIGKAFEAAVRGLRAHLVLRGFVEVVRPQPNPDPLAFFNSTWNSEYDRRRGMPRFERGADGWPSDSVLKSWDRTDRDGRRLEHGEFRHFRDHRGYLMRGRVYGGINGRWMCVFGPGPRDCTHLSANELFTVEPAQVPRRLFPGAKKRVAQLLATAVKREDFEQAIKLRDTLSRRWPAQKVAA